MQRLISREIGSAIADAAILSSWTPRPFAPVALLVGISCSILKTLAGELKGSSNVHLMFGLTCMGEEAKVSTGTQESTEPSNIVAWFTNDKFKSSAMLFSSVIVSPSMCNWSTPCFVGKSLESSLISEHSFFGLFQFSSTWDLKKFFFNYLIAKCISLKAVRSPALFVFRAFFKEIVSLVNLIFEIPSNPFRLTNSLNPPSNKWCIFVNDAVEYIIPGFNNLGRR